MVSHDDGWDIYSKTTGWRKDTPSYGSISRQYLYIGQEAKSSGLNTNATYALGFNPKTSQVALLPDPEGYKVSSNGTISIPTAFATKCKLNGKRIFNKLDRDHDAWVFTATQ